MLFRLVRAKKLMPSNDYKLDIQVKDSLNATATTTAQFVLDCAKMDNQTKPLAFTGPSPNIVPKECASNVTIATMTAEGGKGTHRFELLGGKDAGLFNVNSLTG